MPRPSSKNIRVDFFQMTITPTETIASPLQGFRAIMDGTIANHHDNGGYKREFYGLSNRGAIGFCGSLRKFRNDDLPKISSLGGTELDLPLIDGQGLVEHNCFVFFPRHSVIAIHYNVHANHHTRLVDTLIGLWGTRVELTPLISADTFRRLNQTGTTLVEIEAKIPKPQNPALLPDPDNFSRHALDMLNLSDADNLTFKVGIDQRYSGMNRRLINSLKNSIRTLSQYDPQKLTAKIDENGIISPIDLIADRIKSTQQVEATGRYIPRDTLYNAIEQAYAEVENDINAYFATGETN
ncbi:hypothetical protein F972_02111 [Acinetobacter sp. CIP 102529]|nr:hypothetical protein F972_02111 [Acinetobacter sp. CIP 102529]